MCLSISTSAGAASGSAGAVRGTAALLAAGSEASEGSAAAGARGVTEGGTHTEGTAACLTLRSSTALFQESAVASTLHLDHVLCASFRIPAPSAPFLV